MSDRDHQDDPGAGWTADILGGRFEARTLRLPPDSEGPVVATLVRLRARQPTRRAVLYLHGFVDYFFQRHLAEAFVANGYDFYALDLRKYGRSLRGWQTPNYCTHLAEYLPELTAAAAIVRHEDAHDVLVVNGHSTGGEIASLWADADARAGGVIDALVLNSPWFELNKPWLLRTVGTALIDLLAGVAPKARVGSLGRHYGRSLHTSTGGAWAYDLDWKPLDGFPVLAGWFRAVRRGHAQIAAGLSIDCPVLVCAAGSSGPAERWHPLLDSTDSVLDVQHIAARAGSLGADVTLVRIPGGIHDLALSADAARRHYLDSVFDWLDRRLPAGCSA